MLGANLRMKEFVNHAEALLDNEFTKFIMLSEFTVNDTDLVERWPCVKGIKATSVDSFALHLRFLIQPRDKISCEDIIKILHENKSLSESTRQFKERMDTYNAYIPSIQFNKQSLTNWKYFEIVFYGGLAHHNENKYQNFKKMTQNPIFGIFALVQFRDTAKKILQLIESIKKDVQSYLNEQ